MIRAINLSVPCRDFYTFLLLLLNAVTLQPLAFANLIAICPRPPIPRIPTFCPDLDHLFNGEYTVIPPHMRGPTYFGGIPSGTLKQNRLSPRHLFANPPISPPVAVPFCCRHKFSSFFSHHSQFWHDSFCQPTPTISPTLQFCTFGPIIVTLPAISCPLI